MMFRWCLYNLALVLTVMGAAWRAMAADRPFITPEATYREVARSGYVRGMDITGDLDLSRLQVPAGSKRLVLQDVQIKGRVHSSANGPAVPLSIDRAELQSLELSRARLRAGFALENSTVQGLARFDDAQFDGPFVLHASTLTSGATFRRARFGAAVEIVYTHFDQPAGLSGVSFADVRFAGPARFDRSRFAGNVHFDTSRFEADASFLGLVVSGRASWHNVIFSRDAEFRFCQLGDADYGNAEHMSVFGGLADFRGCTMRSAQFDYVDARGDLMLINVHVAPGDLTLRQATLRGRSDLSGLRVAGRLDLAGAYISPSALQFRWPELAEPLRRAGARSDVLRPLHQRLDALQQKEDARSVWALLAEQVFRERLADPHLEDTEKTVLWLEWWLWGWPTRYGTQLGRIAALMGAAWLLFLLSLLLWPRARLGSWRGPLDEAPPRHRPAPPKALKIERAAAVDRGMQWLAYSFGLLFAVPGLRLRLVAPLPCGLQLYLMFMRVAGIVLLTLLGLTLANVSPVFQALLGKVV